MDGDGEKAGAQKPRPSADGGTNDRPADKDGGEESSPRRRGGRGREGGRSFDGDRHRVARSERQYREGGAAVTEGAGENCCCCLALTLPSSSSSSLRRERERVACVVMRGGVATRAGEQPVSSRRQSVAVGRFLGRSVAPIERGRSLSQRGAAGQRRGGPPNNERSPFPPFLPRTPLTSDQAPHRPPPPGLVRPRPSDLAPCRRRRGESRV